MGRFHAPTSWWIDSLLSACGVGSASGTRWLDAEHDGSRTRYCTRSTASYASRTSWPLVVRAPEVNPVREPDALVAHVRFDERGKETEHGLRLFGTGGTKGPATESPWPKPPRLSST